MTCIFKNASMQISFSVEKGSVILHRGFRNNLHNLRSRIITCLAREI